MQSDIGIPVHDSTLNMLWSIRSQDMQNRKRGKESMPGTDETCSDGIFILIMLIFAGASIYTAETKTMHQNELDSILGAAMEESMEILTVNPTYSIGKEVEGKELAADFIQNMLMRTTSKSTLK